MHELLAQWIIKYMDLQKQKSGNFDESVKSLLKEYFSCFRLTY